MPRPKKQPAPTPLQNTGKLPEEVPEDVRAEAARPDVQADAAIPLPDDVRAEIDAERRARELRSADPDARPAFDEDED